MNPVGNGLNKGVKDREGCKLKDRQTPCRPTSIDARNSLTATKGNLRESDCYRAAAL
jgi:hypothetical protein